MKKYFVLAVVFCLLAVLGWPEASQAAAAKASKLDSKYAKYAQFIVIDKSSNTLTFYKLGKVVKTFSVATGKRSSYTPEGLFPIIDKVKNRPYYKEHIKGGDPKNPLGDRWMGLSVKQNGTTSYAYGIHGTNNESSIGKYVSAGCIRMHNKDIHWLYDQIKVNTMVLIQE